MGKYAWNFEGVRGEKIEESEISKYGFMLSIDPKKINSSCLLLMFSGCRLILSSMVLILAFSGVFAFLCNAGEKMSDAFVSPAAIPGQGTSIRVLWTVSSYHIMSNAAWGENEARALLFKPLDINATTIAFDGQTCRDVVFTSEIIDTTEYLRERYQVTAQSLGIEDKIMQLVKTTCRIPGFDEYTRLSDRRLLVPIQGVLFVFTPAVNY